MKNRVFRLFLFSSLLTFALPFYHFTFNFFRLRNPESLNCVLGKHLLLIILNNKTIMEIRNILRTGYKVLVVTVTLIEAIDLSKSLIGKYRNKKTTASLDTVAGTNSVESA